MACFIFNNLLQVIARGTQNFLGGSWSIPAAIWPSGSRENHEKFGRPCSRRWTTPKGPKDRSGLLVGQASCWWTPGCGPESTVMSFLIHVKAPSLAGRSKVLPRNALGPMATVPLPKCLRCTAGCSISLPRTRKWGEIFHWLWRPPKP